MFTVLGYNVDAGVNDANVDMTAMVDPNFSRRNSHYIFGEPWNMLAAIHFAANATRARYNVPTINGIARHQIYPPNRSATIPSNPQIADWRDYPIAIPMDEEVAIEESNNLGAATEQTFAFMWIAPPTWSRNIPRGLATLVVRFTATITITANGWSADAAITFAENLKGGTYVVIGAEAQAASLLAFRFNFPKAPLTQGRKLLPGTLGTQTLGNVPLDKGMNWLGEWGKFGTFEPPQISCCSLSGGGTTIEGRMQLVYLGPQQL